MYTSDGILFGLTENDAAILSDEDFDAVWSALGKVARARAKANKQDKQALETIAKEDESKKDDNQ